MHVTWIPLIACTRNADDGFLKSSSVRPIACSMACAAGCVGSCVTALLYLLSSMKINMITKLNRSK